MTIVDISDDIAEIRAIANTIVHLDMNEADLFERAAPYLLRILSDKTDELDHKHSQLEAELIALKKRAVA
ncbi:hypothetical protein [Bacillus sp. IG2]|uniref:hypothetical protein n=1 Tax=Bacillus sp. IG2 TaxID=3075931 RepID=UPI0028F817CB|nr:hypothetical protein [Bacillus sp. IG2]MDU0078354.1 hypothetical protein [Bacillus sp. IG2]